MQLWTAFSRFNMTLSVLIKTHYQWEPSPSSRILPQLRGVNHVAHHFGSEAIQMKTEVNAFMVNVLKFDKGMSAMELAEQHGLEHVYGDDDDKDDDEDEFWIADKWPDLKF